MKVGIPKEIHPGERRVAATPQTAKRLQKQGFEVLVQSGAGMSADFSDDSYRDAGCEITDDPAQVWSSDLVLKVREPKDDEIELLRDWCELPLAQQTVWFS